MTDNELYIHGLKKQMQTFSLMECSKNPTWLREFANYNEAHKISERLSVTCRPCYDKVLAFVIKRLSE